MVLEIGKFKEVLGIMRLELILYLPTMKKTSCLSFVESLFSLVRTDCRKGEKC
jgi:hypothetical protein